MPDLVTHVSVASILFRISRSPGHLALFLLGTILPDLLTRPVCIPFPETMWLVAPLHTPVGFILICLLVSSYFEQGIRHQVLVALLAGGFLHMALDSLQTGVGDTNYLWAFPFVSWGKTLGLIGPEDSLYAAPFLLALALGIEAFVRRTRRRRGDN